MTKPWEQEWFYDSHIRRRSSGAFESLVLARVDGTDAECRLASAAPDMARALLTLLEEAKSGDLRFTAPASLAAAHDALKKAGVLP